MDSITNQQRNTALQIAGIIQNYRKVTTRTAKPMATFTVGTFPAKCFDVTVDAAEHWAATGQRVVVAGYLSSHEGTIELVAQSINLAPAGQTDAQTGFTQGGYADISVQEQAPIRERGTITENLSGCVSNLKKVPNHSGRPMITFKIGNISCKAFGELARAIHKSEGKQIEISARKGRFRGATEYAVEVLRTISGTAVDVKDTRTIAPEEHISKTTHTPKAINQTQEMDSDSFDRLLDGAFGSGPHSSEGKVALLDQQPSVNPTRESSREEQTDLSASIEGGSSGPEPIKKHTSVLSASAEEALILQNVQSYRKVEFFPDKYLEKSLQSGSRFASEAARRVLEERARQKAEDNRRSEDLVQVEAA
jgi:hypothetical protein